MCTTHKDAVPTAGTQQHVSIQQGIVFLIKNHTHGSSETSDCYHRCYTSGPSNEATETLNLLPLVLCLRTKQFKRRKTFKAPKCPVAFATMTNALKEVKPKDSGSRPGSATTLPRDQNGAYNIRGKRHTPVRTQMVHEYRLPTSRRPPYCGRGTGCPAEDIRILPRGTREASTLGESSSSRPPHCGRGAGCPAIDGIVRNKDAI